MGGNVLGDISSNASDSLARLNLSPLRNHAASDDDDGPFIHGGECTAGKRSAATRNNRNASWYCPLLHPRRWQFVARRHHAGRAFTAFEFIRGAGSVRWRRGWSRRRCLPLQNYATTMVRMHSRAIVQPSLFRQLMVSGAGFKTPPLTAYVATGKPIFDYQWVNTATDHDADQSRVPGTCASMV